MVLEYIERSHCTICGARLEETNVGRNQPTQQVRQTQTTQQEQQTQPAQQVQQAQPAQQMQQAQPTRQTQQAQPAQQVQQTPQNRQTQHSERVTAYEGEIHRCPNCGETLPSFTAICPACGYEIRGTTANISITEFSSKLGQFQSDEQRSNFIRYFPIPNSKEDIYEFLILASTNIGGSVGASVSEAWMAKVEQCYQKAKLSFNNTDAMAQIQKTYDDIQDLLQNAKKAEKRKKIVHLIIRSIASIIGIISLIIAVSVNSFGGNSILFELPGCALLIGSAIALSRPNCSLPDLGIGFISGVLTLTLSFLLDSNFLELISGAAVMIIVAIGFFNYLSRNSKDTNQQTAVPNMTSNTPTPNQSSTVAQPSANSSPAVPTTTTSAPTVPISSTPSATASNVPMPVPAVHTNMTPTAPIPTQSSGASASASAAPNTSVSTVSTPNAPNIILNISVPQSPNVSADNLLSTRIQSVHSVKIPQSIIDEEETNYAAVEALLVQAGFTNVKTVPLNDLLLGIFDTPGEIDTIKISGRELDEYRKHTFDSDVPILITYHSKHK